MYFLVLICMSLLMIKKHLYIKTPKGTFDLYNLYTLLGYAIYIIFAVFRKIDIGGIGGTDAIAYFNFFMNANIPYFQYIKSMPIEIGFASVLWLLRRVTDNYLFILLLFHSITYILTLKFIRYIKCKNLVVIMLLNQILLSQFNTLRMSLCIIISMYVMIYIAQKQFCISSLLVLLAISIHNSAIILLPALITNFYFKNKRVNAYKISFIICAYMVVSYASYELLIYYFKNMSKYFLYINNIFSFAYLSYIFILLTILFGILKYKTLLKTNYINRAILLSMTALPICIFLNFKMPIFYRVALIFLQLSYILAATELRAFKFNKQNLLLSLIVLNTIYLYSGARIYNFFTIDLQYIGVPYISTIFR